MGKEDKTDGEFNLLATQCSELLDGGNIEGAVASVNILQVNLQSAPKALSTLQKAQVACLLVDVGAASRDETMVRGGLRLFEQDYAAFSEAICLSSLEYNLGNAKKTLYDLAVIERQERFRPEAIELLTESKAHYWRALKLTGSTIPSPGLLVNLANALDQCGRVVEALMWYNRALTIEPTFGMAHLNRGLALLFLSRLADTYSIRLLDEARHCFRRAETSGQLSPELVEQAQSRWTSLNQRLLKLGYHEEKLQEATHLHTEEYRSHDPYWQWCLENYVVLSEHALYCGCAGARRDDLAIPKQASPIGGEFVPKLELLLNRIKSEFCLARALYYQGAIASGEAGWDVSPFEGAYTELYEGEAIGIRAEFLRTSFRLCFGVLDKVARGIADLFGLAPGSETLYFESFWRPTRERTKGEERRWGLINRQENLALVALYSLATDLNRAGGEWGHFKKDRNQLEHGLLLVRKGDAAGIGGSSLVDLVGVDTIDATEFTERTFRMLQFTVSAVFSFAFCVRLEGQKSLGLEGQAVCLDKKTDVGKL
jgi:tetratricopeptide (TPR) repeat protein